MGLPKRAVVVRYIHEGAYEPRIYADRGGVSALDIAISEMYRWDDADGRPVGVVSSITVDGRTWTIAELREAATR